MREIGILSDETRAKRFSDYLYVQGIDNQIEQEDDGWTVWVHSEDQIDQAKRLLSQYKQNPQIAEKEEISQKAQKRRQSEEKEQEEHRKRMKASRVKFRTFSGIGRLTATLIIISVVVSIISMLGRNQEFLKFLSITKYEISGNYVRWQPGLQEIFHGEIWRLITPIFIHYGFLHILFNMLWLKDLGSMIENLQGIKLYAILVFTIAIGSNLAQYFVSGPTFGGMSGVVYGLLGYIWIRGKFDPFSGLYLENWIVVMMIGWFVLGLTGMIGHIANTAHGMGLAMGMAWGYVLARFTRYHKR